MRSASTLVLVLALAGCKDLSNGSSTQPVDAFSMPVPSAGAEVPPDRVVASWAGGQMTYGELLTEVKGQLVKQEIEYLNERYNTMRRAIDGKVNETLMTEEAEKRGLADSEALVEQINAENGKVTDAEVASYYEENKKRFRGKPLEQVKEAVTAQLSSARQREAVNKLIEQLRGQAGVAVALEPPELPRMEVALGDGTPRGAVDAPVAIVEFADYQCPYCSRGYETMKQVMAANEGKVRWYFRNFPLSFHKEAMGYAVAANCASQQGKFWEMHDALLEKQKDMEAAGGVLGLARTLGLDEAAFKACTEDKELAKKIAQDMSDAQAVGVSGTPAYFINGIMISGAQPLENFQAIIDREYKAAKGG